jgi:hypothetical protein
LPAFSIVSPAALNAAGRMETVWRKLSQKREISVFIGGGEWLK